MFANDGGVTLYIVNVLSHFLPELLLRKQESPILDTDAGSTTSATFVSWKVKLPRVVMLVGISIYVNPVQPWNAEFATLVSFVKSLNSLNDTILVFPLKVVPME